MSLEEGMLRVEVIGLWWGECMGGGGRAESGGIETWWGECMGGGGSAESGGIGTVVE